MYTDAFLLVSDAQAFTVDAYSSNSIDLGNVTPKRDVGTGEPLVMAIAVDVYATPTGTTYEFRFVQSANADLTSEDVLVSRIYAATDLTAGALLYLPVPPGAVTKRYIGAAFNNVSGTTTVTATIAIGPQSMIQSWKPYAKGYTIS